MQYALESWGVRFGVTLRSKPATFYPDEITRMIREKGFHHPGSVRELRIESTFGAWRNAYEVRTIGNDRVVIDHATNLMWQQSGSPRFENNELSYEEMIRPYLDQQNEQRYAGFADWRLPTIEELASLMEPRGGVDGWFIDSIFDTRVQYCLSADTVLMKGHPDEPADALPRPCFAVSGFSAGQLSYRKKGLLSQNDLHIRAVRSMKADELTAGNRPAPK